MQTRPFPADEYRLRLVSAQQALVRAGLDCLMITDDRNFYYFVGYDAGVQRARARFLLIPAAGDPVLLVAPNLESTMRELSPYSDVRLYFTMGRPPVNEVIAILCEKVGASGRIGAELGYEQRLGMSVTDFFQLRDAAPYEWVDAAALIWGVRLVKTSAELQAVRAAVGAANTAIPRVFAGISPGMTEVQTSELFAQELRRAGAASGQAAVVSGPGSYFRSMARPRQRPIVAGDMVWADVAAQVSGYWCDFSRAATVGPPTPDQVRLQRLVHEVTMAGVESIGPGITAAHVAGVCDREMAARGLTFNSGALRYGHGLGIDITEPPHIATYDTTVLQPGMVITVEPAVHTEFGRFNVEENVLVTETGREVLTRVQWELFTI